MQEAVSTGFSTLDHALGTAGFPRGRIVELCGERSSGKTSLAARVIAQALQGDGLAAYIDLSGTFHPPTAAATGIHLPSLVLIRPQTATEALEATSTLLQSEGFDVIVHDLSESTVLPDTSSLARLATIASKTRTLLLFLTSSRRRRSRWAASGIEPTPLDFFATVRLQVQRRGGFWYGYDDVHPPVGYLSPLPYHHEDAHTHLAALPGVLPRLELAGYRLAVTVLKNKLGPSGAILELELSPWGAGVYAHDEDRLSLDTTVSDMGGAAALPGAAGATGSDWRRAV